MKDYYKELGLDPGLGFDDLKDRIFDEKKKWTHRKNSADPAKQKLAEDKLVLLDEADELFATAADRAAYDRKLSASKEASRGSGSAGSSSAARTAQGGTSGSAGRTAQNSASGGAGRTGTSQQGPSSYSQSARTEGSSQAHRDYGPAGSTGGRQQSYSGENANSAGNTGAKPASSGAASGGQTVHYTQGSGTYRKKHPLRKLLKWIVIIILLVELRRPLGAVLGNHLDGIAEKAAPVLNPVGRVAGPAVKKLDDAVDQLIGKASSLLHGAKKGDGEEDADEEDSSESSGGIAGMLSSLNGLSITKEEGTEAIAAASPLSAADAEASSVLVTGSGREYGAWNTLDGDTDTSWQEGEDGYGEGSTLTYYFDSAAAPQYIYIRPGNARSDEAFTDNGRPSKITITAGEKSGQFELDDGNRWQLFGIEGCPEVTEIRITIDSVYPGDSYEDTCIAEIVFY